MQVCRVARHNLAYLGVIVALFVIIFVWAKLLPLHLQQEWNEAELSASLLVALTWSVLVLEVIRSRVLLPPTEDLLRNARGSAWAQMLAQVMVDFPYALIMSAVALSAAYASHRLNPNSVNAAFATACLVIGLSAWQATTAFIFLAARCSRLAFLALFLLLAVSVLCNGQLIPIRSLPWVLQCGAYVLPPALLQRALVANDLQCCYLTLTCNALRLGHFSTPKCPAGLRFSGDGSDEGNLGRSFLEVSFDQIA